MTCRFLNVALLLVAVSAHAAESAPARAGDEIVIDAKVGLGGFVRQGCAAPVRIEIQNQGSDARGLLTATRTYYGGASRRYEFPVVLPGGTVFRKTVTIPLGGQPYGMSSPPVVAFEPESGRRVETQTAQGAPLSGKRFVVVIGSRGSVNTVSGAKAVPWGLLASQGLGGGATMAPGTGPGSRGATSALSVMVQTQLASVAPEDAPEDWQAYEAVDSLVLPGTMVAKLSVAQRSAIAQWVAAGGWLVLTGGTATDLADDPHLSPLLPCAVNGLTSLPDLRALNARYARGARLRDIPLLKADPGSSAVLLKEREHPLIIAGPYGLGTVTFLAFDPLSKPFQAWSGAKALWEDVLWLKKPRGMVVASPSLAAQAVGRSIQESAGTQSASITTVIWFLVAYFLLVVPLNRIVLRKLGKTELAWVTVPVIAVGFTCGSYFFARGLKGQRVIVTQSSLSFSGPRTSRALTTNGFMVFSPALRSYDVTLPDGVRTLFEVTETGRDEWRKRFNIVLRVVDPPVLRDAGVGMWASRKFAFPRMADRGGGLKCSLQGVLGKAIRGTIRNDTSRPLRGCGFFLGSSFAPVGTLAPGQSRTFRLVLSAGNPASRGTMSGLPAQASQLFRLQLAHRSGDASMRYGPRYPPYGSPGESSPRWTDGAWAVGFSTQPSAEIEVGKRGVGEAAATVVASRSGVTAADGHVVVPPDATGLLIEAVPSGTRAGGMHRGMALQLPRGRCVIKVAPPVEADGSRWTRGVLYVWTWPDGSSYPVACQGYDFRKGRWTPLGTASLRSGFLSVDVSDPQRFVEPGTGMLRLALDSKSTWNFTDARMLLIGKR